MGHCAPLRSVSATILLRVGCPSQLARMALEGSIIPIIEDMFKEGLALHGIAPGIDAGLLATTAA